ncbi:MAG TPA: FecR domain-containing protein [Polyangia bacterium]|nr:FecR domain-containing protein [Polyangia bacterium]
MKDSNEALEQRCLAIGDLLAEALPGPEGPPAAMPPGVAAAFDRAPVRPRHWRRPLALSFLAVAAAAGFVVWLTVRARPIEFAVDGTVAEADGFFEARGQRTVQARFSDGTVVAVQPGGAAQVKSCSADGATVSVSRGTASFAVKHRPHASWHVEVGRFDIAVTGTEFEVRNANPNEGFELRMKSGAVIVRGPLTGTGIPLFAGQRLVASLSQRTLIVGEVAAPAPSQSPAQPPSLDRPAIPSRVESRVESREEPPRRPRPRAKPAALASAEPIVSETRPAPSTPVALQPPRFDPPNEPPVTALPPSAPQPPSVEPFVAPPPPVLAVGGASCSEGAPPQISFDRPGELAGVSAGLHSGMSNPVLDATRSWCGAHSLRYDLYFDGLASPQSGEAILKLPQMVDLRGRTVVVHFYVDGPADARFDARILADDVGRRAGNTYAPGLTPGKWYAITTTFHGPSGIFEPRSNVASAAQIQGLVVRIDATGDRRTWSGTIYIDDVSWK